MRPPAPRRLPRRPRLHRRMAVAAFGLSSLGAALLTAPPQPATFASPAVIVTDLGRAGRGPDLATPPPAVAAVCPPSTAPRAGARPAEPAPAGARCG